MSISKETIIEGFKRFLGREPESEDVIRAHQVFSTEAQLESALTSSQEYAQRKQAAEQPVKRTIWRKKTVEARAMPSHLSTSALRVTVFGNCAALRQKPAREARQCVFSA